MGEAEPGALQGRGRPPASALSPAAGGEQGFVILHCHVRKLELEAVAGVRALQASGQVESPQCTRAAVISQFTEASARCRNGETFALTAKAMARAQVMVGAV